MRTCLASDCDRTDIRARGLCIAHYEAARRASALGKFPRRTVLERFMEKVEETGDCWLWTGAISAHGYGKFRFDGRIHYAHRISYELLVGPIPEGLEIDHTCHHPGECDGGPGCQHRRCVNPDHLEAVTGDTNRARGCRGAGVATHCARGHRYDEANTYRHPRTGRRACRACNRERKKA